MSYDSWKLRSPDDDRGWDEDEIKTDEPPEFWEGRTGKWWIVHAPPPIPKRMGCDWQFRHDDYDGPEDGRSGFGPSWADCVSQIQEMEAEMDDDRQRFEYEMGERE